MKISNKKRTIIFFVFLIIIYLLTLRGYPGNLHPNGTTPSTKIYMNTPPFETSMERGRYAQVISLGDSHKFNVDEFYTFLKPDIAWYNGHFYSTFPSGTALLATPLYLLGKLFGLSQVFSYLVSVIFSVLTAFVIIKIASKLNLSKTAGIFAAMIYSTGSVAWAYTASISAHPVSAFILSLGFLTYFYIDKNNDNTKYYLLIWFLFGLNLFIDYPNLIVFIPILIASLIKTLTTNATNQKEVNIKIPIDMILGTLSFFAVLTLFFIYNMNLYSKPIAFSNTYSIKFLETSGRSIENTKLSNDIFKDKNYSSRFSISQTFEGIKTLITSRDRGLLYFSPIFLIAFHGLYVAIKKKKQHIIWFVTTSFVLNLIVYASYDDPWGGWAFGPRYLIITIPFLALLCAYAFDDLFYKKGLKKVLLKFLIGAGLIFSSGISLLGALTTNAVPPSIEVYGTTYMYNWNYLNNSGVSSFFYKIAFHNLISPVGYFLLLFGIVVLFVTGFLLVFREQKS